MSWVCDICCSVLKNIYLSSGFHLYLMKSRPLTWKSSLPVLSYSAINFAHSSKGNALMLITTLFHLGVCPHLHHFQTTLSHFSSLCSRFHTSSYWLSICLVWYPFLSCLFRFVAWSPCPHNRLWLLTFSHTKPTTTQLVSLSLIDSSHHCLFRFEWQSRIPYTIPQLCTCIVERFPLTTILHSAVLCCWYQ